MCYISYVLYFICAILLLLYIMEEEDKHICECSQQFYTLALLNNHIEHCVNSNLHGHSILFSVSRHFKRRNQYEFTKTNTQYKSSKRPFNKTSTINYNIHIPTTSNYFNEQSTTTSRKISLNKQFTTHTTSSTNEHKEYFNEQYITSSKISLNEQLTTSYNLPICTTSNSKKKI